MASTFQVGMFKSNQFVKGKTNLLQTQKTNQLNQVNFAKLRSLQKRLGRPIDLPQTLRTIVCFVSFWYYGFGQRSYKNTKILCNIFVYIFQKSCLSCLANGKHKKENHTTKVTKLPKTKRQKYEMNETFIQIVRINQGRIQDF